MENQHRKISGYRELTQDEIDLINECKSQASKLGATIDAVGTLPDVDKRSLAIAKTELQTGMMWLIRSIARPEGF